MGKKARPTHWVGAPTESKTAFLREIGLGNRPSSIITNEYSCWLINKSE